MNLRTLSLLSLAIALPLYAQEKESEGMKDKMSTLIKEDSKGAAKNGKAAQAPAKTATTESKVSSDKDKDKPVDLPELKVEASKLPAATPAIVEARAKMRETQETIDREKERTIKTDTDKALNGDKISVLGPLSSKARADDAKRRIEENEVKQSVAACVADPDSDEENKKLLKMLEDLEYQKKHSQ